MPLGIAGFTYADLTTRSAFAICTSVFCERVAAADPDLWAQWDAYRRPPTRRVADRALRPDRPDGAARQPLRRAAVPRGRRRRPAFATARTANSSRCSASRSTSSASARCRSSRAASTSRSIRPTSRSSTSWRAPWAATSITSWRSPRPDARCSTRGRVACDRHRRREGAGRRSQLDALKRWCAACLHDPGYRPWVIFRFPETLDYFNLVQVQRPRPELPEAMLGPDDRLRRRDGFKLTDPRWNTREIVSEIHYCVLCHERDKDSCSKGLRDKEGAVTAESARHSAARLPARREDLRDAPGAEGRRCHRRAGDRHHRQPDGARAPATASATTA